MEELEVFNLTYDMQGFNDLYFSEFVSEQSQLGNIVYLTIKKPFVVLPYKINDSRNKRVKLNRMENNNEESKTKDHNRNIEDYRKAENIQEGNINQLSTFEYLPQSLESTFRSPELTISKKNHLLKPLFQTCSNTSIQTGDGDGCIQKSKKKVSFLDGLTVEDMKDISTVHAQGEKDKAMDFEDIIQKTSSCLSIEQSEKQANTQKSSDKRNHLQNQMYEEFQKDLEHMVEQEQQGRTEQFQVYLNNISIFSYIRIQQSQLKQQNNQNHKSNKVQALSQIYFKILIYQGIFQIRNGLASEALQTFQHCIQCFEIKDYILLSKLHIRCGQISLNLLYFEVSMKHFRTALDIQDLNDWSIQSTQSLFYISILYSLLGFTEIAKQIAFASLAIVKDNYEDVSIQIAEAYNFLGQIYRNCEDFEMAIEFLGLSLEIKAKCNISEKSNLQPLNALGILCHQLGYSTTAQKHFEMALTLIDKPNTIQEAQILNNLAVIQIDINLYEMASELLEKSISIYTLYYKEFHPSLQRALYNFEKLKEIKKSK